jgi:hypothetical protein
MKRLALIAVLMVSAAAVFAGVAHPAPATTLAGGAHTAEAGGGCGWISAAGVSRYVEAGGVSCAYGRRWSRRMLAGRGAPRGWDRCWAGRYRGGCARDSGAHFLYHP